MGRNIQVVTDIVHDGKYAAKVTIHEDDVFNAQQQRVQDRRTPAESWLERGLRHLGVRSTCTWPEPPNDRDNFFYWEETPPPQYDNVDDLVVGGAERRRPKARSSSTARGNLLDATARIGAADFPIGKWHQLAMHIHWSESADKGNTRLWFDGVLVLDKKLQTKGPESVYFCQAGNPSQSVHRPLGRHDLLRQFLSSPDTLKEFREGSPLV